MSNRSKLGSRRKFIAGAAGAVGATALGVKSLSANGLVPPDATGVFAPERILSYGAHRLLAPNSMARELPRSAITNPSFPNGKVAPEALEPDAAANWSVSIDGLVDRPMKLSVADLKAMPQSSQITAIACEEGWSYVAEWIGAPLAHVLDQVGVKPEAKYMMYFSTQERWWDSIDMNDAMHPQTLIAYGMNGGDLPPRARRPHARAGAPATGLQEHQICPQDPAGGQREAVRQGHGLPSGRAGLLLVQPHLRGGVLPPAQRTCTLKGCGSDGENRRNPGQSPNSGANSLTR